MKRVRNGCAMSINRKARPARYFEEKLKRKCFICVRRKLMLDANWCKLCSAGLLCASGFDWTKSVGEIWLARIFSLIVVGRICEHCQTLPTLPGIAKIVKVTATHFPNYLQPQSKSLQQLSVNKNHCQQTVSPLFTVYLTHN